MTGIILLEVISIVSFIYSLLTIFFPFASINEIFIIFIWSIGVSLVFSYSYKKSKIYQIVSILLLAPLIFYNNIKYIAFVVISTFFIYTYITKSLMKGSHREYTDKIKKTYIVYGAICILLLLIDEGFNNFINISIYFTIIYLVTTIILLRATRHLEAGMDMKKIRQVNLRYLVMIFTISSIAISERLRSYIFLIIRQIYLFTIDIIMKILHYPIVIMVTIVNKVITYIMGKDADYGILESLLDELTKAEEPISSEKVLGTDNIFVQRAIQIILILFIFYMIYKLIIKTKDREYKELQYTEKREYIRDPKKRKKRFFKEKYPKELNQQIRYYYRRYMDKLDQKGIRVLKTDTSLEVNRKAEKTFKEGIEEMRNIYINSRYGNKDVDKNKVKEMKNLYKNL
ncbi:hypothetical protein RBU61_04760 [Tissierella sp. MB52-C2]|uniref:hypothetical protein n=1 Tax=Tissierella sp. MB52-C2 TaxID=3070999 RepID=UPI00280B4000|nr:hypothetical protein [Tissierella sp. MB52-C2]WMM25988.1 hypothetical protein RBU61_04760 [Tissierella sp. MB52-C2]